MIRKISFIIIFSTILASCVTPNQIIAEADIDKVIIQVYEGVKDAQARMVAGELRDGTIPRLKEVKMKINTAYKITRSGSASFVATIRVKATEGSSQTLEIVFKPPVPDPKKVKRYQQLFAAQAVLPDVKDQISDAIYKAALGIAKARPKTNFNVKKLTVEFSFTASQDTSGTVSVKLTPVGASIKDTATSSASHKITLVFAK